MTHETSLLALKQQLDRVVTELTLLSPTHDSSTAPKQGRYLLNTDAGIRKGEAAIGLVLSDPDDHVVETYSGKIQFVETNSEKTGPAKVQQAEYRALIKGLELARRHHIERLRVYLDNQLVVDQINELADVKHPVLVDLRRETVRLLDRLPELAKNPHHRVCWVPRERNKIADALVRRELY